MNEIKLKITIDGKEAIASLKLTDANVKELYNSFKYGQQEVTGLTTAISQGFNNAREILGGFQLILSTLKSTLGEPLNVYVDAEAAHVSFEVLLGSAEKAKSMLNELKEFGATTPLEFKDLRTNANLLLNFGISAEEILPTLRTLGDISGGNAQKLNSLALAFAQSSSAGKLTGQDLLQMVNAGFNPLQQIAEQTGVSIGKLKKEMEKGNITFEEVKQAFVDATSEGGRFFGMLDRQGGTSGGALSNFNDSLTIAKEQTGRFVAEALTPLLRVASEVIGKLNESNPTILGIIGLTGTLTTVMITLRTTGILPAIFHYNFLRAAIQTTNYQMHLASMAGITANRTLVMLNSTIRTLIASIGPGGWLIIGLSAYIGLASAFASKTEGTTKELSEEEKQLRKNKTEMNSLFETLKDTNIESDKRIAAFNKLKETYPGYLSNLSSEKDSVQKIEEAQRLANIEFERKIKLVAQERVLKEYYEEIADIEYQKIKTEKLLAQSKKDALIPLDGYYDENRAKVKSGETGIVLYTTQLENLNNKLKTSQEGLNDFKKRMDSISSVNNNKPDETEIKKKKQEQEKLARELYLKAKEGRERELADLKYKYEDDLKRASGNKDLLLKVEEDYQREKIKIQRKYNKEETELLNKLFEDSKKLPYKNRFSPSTEFDIDKLKKENNVGGHLDYMMPKEEDPVERVIKRSDRLIGTVEIMKDAYNSLGSTMSGVWSSQVQLIKNNNSMLQQAINYLGQYATQLLTLSLFKGVLSLISGTGFVSGFMGALTGNKFANGAVVTRPTLAIVGEGGEPEGVFPLSYLDNMMSSRPQVVYVQMEPVELKARGMDLRSVIKQTEHSIKKNR